MEDFWNFLQDVFRGTTDQDILEEEQKQKDKRGLKTTRRMNEGVLTNLFNFGRWNLKNRADPAQTKKVDPDLSEDLMYGSLKRLREREKAGAADYKHKLQQIPQNKARNDMIWTGKDDPWARANPLPHAFQKDDPWARANPLPHAFQNYPNEETLDPIQNRRADAANQSMRRKGVDGREFAAQAQMLEPQDLEKQKKLFQEEKLRREQKRQQLYDLWWKGQLMNGARRHFF